MIYRNQPLATINRLNQAQLNTMQLGTTSPTTEQMASKPGNELSLINTDLDDHQKEQIRQLIQKFPDVFSEQPARTKKAQHQINLVPGAQPFNSPSFRYAPARKQIIE